MPVESLRCYLCFGSTVCKSEVPTTSSDSVSLLEWLAEQRSIYLCLPVCYKGHYRDHRWTARWRSIGSVWEGPKARSFCPHGTGVHHPLSTWIHSPTQKLIKSCSRVFIELNMSVPLPLLTGTWVWLKILLLWVLGLYGDKPPPESV